MDTSAFSNPASCWRIWSVPRLNDRAARKLFLLIPKPWLPCMAINGYPYRSRGDSVLYDRDRIRSWRKKIFENVSMWREIRHRSLAMSRTWNGMHDETAKLCERVNEHTCRVQKVDILITCITWPRVATILTPFILSLSHASLLFRNICTSPGGKREKINKVSNYDDEDS